MLSRVIIFFVAFIIVSGTTEGREKRSVKPGPVFANPKPLREKPIIEKPVIEKSKKVVSVHEKPVFEKTPKTKPQRDKAAFDQSKFEPSEWDKTLIETKPVDDSGPELEPYPLGKPTKKRARWKPLPSLRPYKR